MTGRHARVALLAASIFLAVTPIALAEQTADVFKGFGASSKDPINVDAKTLEVSEVRDQRISTFSGGVTMQRGDTVLTANIVKLFQPIKAKEKAAQDKDAGTGAAKEKPAVVDKGKVDGGDPAVPKDKGLPESKAAAKDKSTGTDPANDPPTKKDKETARVAAVAGDKGAAPPKAKEKQSGFSRIEATGNVKVTSETQTVTGDKGVFDTVANTIVVTGNVVVTQEGNVVRGDRLVVDLTTGKATIDQSGGRIKGVFTPETESPKPAGTKTAGEKPARKKATEKKPAEPAETTPAGK